MRSKNILWTTLGSGPSTNSAAEVPAAAALRAAVEAAGFSVHGQDGPPVPGGWDARIVHVLSAPPEAWADVDAAARRAPTLWIVHDDVGELWALRRASPTDDVACTPSAPVLAARLQRLLAQAAPDDLDPLTGLHTRRSFGRIVRQVCEEQLPGEHHALIYIDLDRFKPLNDQFGHDAGDLVLQKVASVLRQSCRPEDHVCRLGGDEFVVLMQRYDSTSLIRDAERLVEHIGATTFGGPLSDMVLTASAGLARLRPGSLEPQLLRQADSAMYEAKAQGRGRLVHFELINDGTGDDTEGNLRRFNEVTRMFSDRMTRMVSDMGRQLLEASRVQALQDPLTGAHNRGFFKERLPREIERARKGDRPLAMALLDLDDFHEVNVTYGWPSGDRVLQQFVEVATAQLRMTDWLARYGGEEFAIVLPDTLLESAEAVLERLRQAVQETAFTALDGRRIPVTISIGVAALVAATPDTLALTDAASSACLQAKGSGKNRVVVAP